MFRQQLDLYSLIVAIKELRGLWDDYTSVSSNPNQNHGNFLELLNFHRAGYLVLNYFPTAAQNASYIY